MNLSGVILGFWAIFIIGLGHVWVIRGEYFLGRRMWPLPLVLGIACLGGSLLVGGDLASGLLGIAGGSFLWGIRELFEQHERVEQGRFARGPGHR